MTETRTAPKGRGLVARRLGALALACAVTLGLGQTARAQFAFDDAVMPPRVIAWRLADRGFSGMTRPRYDGRVYVVEAVDPVGVPVRLFVDPAGGAIIGRQRLGEPQTYARLERPAPGFGWTEEEPGPRRILRPLPPEDLSGAAPPPARRSGTEAVRPETNPRGINPDGSIRVEPRKKVARATPPTRQSEPKPALRATPEAPAPKLAPVEAAKPDAKPEIPAAAIDKAAPAEAPRRSRAAGDGAHAEAGKSAVPEWKEPPPEGKRPVRVIDGATVVPGTSENKDGAQ